MAIKDEFETLFSSTCEHFVCPGFKPKNRDPLEIKVGYRLNP